MYFQGRKAFLSAMIACVSALGAVAAKAGDVTLRADLWCPYNCEPDARPGYLVEIAKAALEPAGHKVDYRLMPWSDTLAAVAGGHATAAVGASRNEAPDLVYPELPLGELRPTIIVRKGKEPASIDAGDLASLAGIRFGYVKDYYYSEEMNAFIDARKGQPNMVEVTGGDVTRDLVAMLVEGRIDAAVEDTNIIGYQLESQGHQGLFTYHPLNQRSDVSIGFSPRDPDSPKYARLVDEKLVELRASGQLADLLAKYGLRDWRK